MIFFELFISSSTFDHKSVCNSRKRGNHILKLHQKALFCS